MKRILITFIAFFSIEANAQTYLIKIGDLKGDSELANFTGNDGWSSIYNYNLNISGNLQFIKTGFVPAAGKAECGMIEITKKYNYQTSNNLSTALHTGIHFPQVEIVGLKNNPAGGGLIEFIHYTFTEVVFSKFIKTVNTGPDSLLLEDIGFKAESFLIDHTTFDPITGAPTKLSFGWNFKDNVQL